MGIGWKSFRQNSVGVERTVDFIAPKFNALLTWIAEEELMLCQLG